MTFSRKRQTEAKLRADERRQREDDAPRLKQQISTLRELCLEIEERVGSASSSVGRYVRHVVIDRAPALFEIKCGDERCRDGGHDLTNEIMRGLRSSALEFQGEDACYGTLGSGSAACGRVLRFVARAKYQ
jgi:hypothetical protein